MIANFFCKILIPPNPDSKTDRRFVMIILVFAIIYSLLYLSFNTGTVGSIRPILISLTILAVISLLFAYWNILQFARIILPNAVFVAITSLLVLGGVHDDAIGGYYLLLIFAAFLQGRWGLLVFGLLNTIAILVIGMAETGGKLTTHFGPLTDPSTVFTTAFFMAAASLGLFFFVTHLSNMIQLARMNEQKQIRANRDLIELKEVLEQRVIDRTAELQALFASMQDLVIVFNKEGRYLRIVNSESLLMNSPDRLIGNTIQDVFPKKEAVRLVNHIQEVLKSQKTLPIEYPLMQGNRKIWYNASVSPLSKDTVIWVARDITERKQTEEKSIFIGTHDEMTGLYNRTYFEEELNRLKQSRLIPISIFMMDVDKLKTINDNQGHSAGDELLMRAARVFMESFRAEDMVARIGGDEFAAILPRADEAAAQLVVDRIHHFLEVNNAGKDNMLELSIGVATCHEKGLLTATLKQADDRMYLDKQGRN